MHRSEKRNHVTWRWRFRISSSSSCGCTWSLNSRTNFVHLSMVILLREYVFWESKVNGENSWNTSMVMSARIWLFHKFRDTHPILLPRSLNCVLFTMERTEAGLCGYAARQKVKRHAKQYLDLCLHCCLLYFHSFIKFFLFTLFDKLIILTDYFHMKVMLYTVEFVFL